MLHFLKPHVSRFAISGFTAWELAVLCWSTWLLPHNVLPNAQNAGSAGKQTGPGVHRQNGHQFKMAVRVTSQDVYAQNAWARIRAMHVIGLLHTEVVWHTSHSLHAIWCSPTRPHRDWHSDWLCDGRWTLGMGQWDIHIFLRREQCLTHLLKQGTSHALKYHFGMIYELHLRVAICGWNMSTDVKRVWL